MNRWRYFGLWLVAGVLMGLALLLPFGWLLMMGGLGLLLHLLSITNSTKRAGLGLLLAGTTHMFITLTWVFGVVPLTQLGLTPLTQLAFVGFIWLTSSVLIGFGFMVVVALIHYVAGQNKFWLFGLFPFGVITGELFGRLLFSLYTLGPDGGLSVAFSFGQVGYALANHGGLVLLARLGGVYVLTPVVATLSVSGYLFWRRRCYWSLALGVTVLFLTSFYHPPTVLPPELDDIGVLQINLPFSLRQEERDNQAKLLAAAVDEAAARQLHTVILPEDSRYGQSNPIKSQSSSPLSILDTARVETESGPIQRATFLTSTTLLVIQDKRQLVPFGEYVPLLHTALFSSLGFAPLVDQMKAAYGYRRGASAILPPTLSMNVPAVLFCYESVTPYAVHQLMKAETPPPYIAHVVSHAWFTDTRGFLKYQLRSMLITQAVWNDVFILQSANQAPAAVYSPTGSVYTTPRTTTLWTLYRVYNIVHQSE